MYIVAFILYALRGIRGPTIFDSTISIDALCYDVTAFMVILSVYFRSYILLGSGILMALWAYILDIVIARYYEKEVGIEKSSEAGKHGSYK